MIEWILSIPFFIKILLTLVVILILNRVLKQLMMSVILGTLVLAFWSGHHLSNIAEISWERFSSIDNLFLMLVIFLVIWLSSQMKETGLMKDLVINVKSKISQKSAMAILPAIIGLLPMPGGAVFSAPMVDDCDHNKTIDSNLKTKTNYWFRHIWEYWWPLYPGVLLAIDITGIPLWQIIFLHLPLSLFSVFGGTFFLLKRIKPQSDILCSTQQSDHSFISLILPIIMVIVTYILIQIFFSGLSHIDKYLPMVVGIIVAMIYLQLNRRLTWSQWNKIIFSKSTLKLVFIVAFIRIYGAFIEAKLPDGTLLMTHVRSELEVWNIPILAIIMIIPFLSGLSTGVAIGFVGASFPVVMSILGQDPPMSQVLSYTVIAYGFGFIGMMLSPVHVCLLLTNEYFKTNLIQNILQLVKPSSVVLTGSLIIHYIILYTMN